MRFARHILLPEIGERGQARLAASSVRPVGGDERAREVARTYLARAGVGLHEEGRPAPIPDVRAGRPELAEAASYLAGALAAVEVVKAIVGAGVPGDVHVVLTGPEGDA